MKVYTLKRTIEIPVDIHTAWNFFSNPLNLPKITPAEMKFRVLTESLPEKIYPGLIISYSVSPIPGFQVNWLSEIKHVHENEYFVDEQRSGPYAFWYHRHSFKETKDGTLMEDAVHYSIPLGIIGKTMHALFVKRKLKRIFDYREKVIAAYFNNKQND
jgi:ligand-binding SRPBCC domain-containing protein